MITKTNKKRSLLFIDKQYQPGKTDSARHVKELADYCIRRGWDVSILFLSAKAKDIKQKNKGKKGPRLIPVQYDFEKNTHKRYAGLWPLLTKGLLTKKHDVIISTTNPPMVAAIGNIIAKVKGSKHIHWLSDLYPDLFSVLEPEHKNSRYMNTWSRKAMKKADHVIAAGRCMEKYLKDTGIDPWSVSTIPNWASVSIFDSGPAQTKTAQNSKQKKQIEPKFRVMYAGNLGKAHEIEPLLHAMQRLSKSNPEIEFVFVGDSVGHKFLRQKHSRYNLKNSRFLKPQPEAKFKDLMELGDIHIVSMNEQALGMMIPSKFYSIIAAKRPVVYVGPEQSEVGLVIKETACGLIAPSQDKKAFVDAILAFRNDPDLWFNAQEGAIKARETYNPAKSLVKWEETLDRVYKS